MQRIFHSLCYSLLTLRKPLASPKIYSRILLFNQTQIYEFTWFPKIKKVFFWEGLKLHQTHVWACLFFSCTLVCGVATLLSSSPVVCILAMTKQKKYNKNRVDLGPRFLVDCTRPAAELFAWTLQNVQAHIWVIS